MTTMPSSKRRRRRQRLGNIVIPPIVAIIAALFHGPSSHPSSPFVTAAAAAAVADDGGDKRQQRRCERLPTSLVYPQDEAPADVSAILRVVVEKVNRDVTGVIDVEVGWTGAELHRRVGERIVRCTVTRLAESAGARRSGGGDDDDDDDDDDYDEDGGGLEDEGGPIVVVDEHGRSVVTQCFDVPFTILDVDECRVPPDTPMAHACHPPAVCVNTLGSYECACPSDALDDALFYNNDTDNEEGGGGGGGLVVVGPGFWNDLQADAAGRPWDASPGSSALSSCPGLPSTRGCCDDDGHSREGGRCRSSFRCPIDPCASDDRGDRPGGEDDDGDVAVVVASGDDDGTTFVTRTKRRRREGSSKTNDGAMVAASTGAAPACAPNALCVRAASPLSRPNFACRCPPGLMGNGRPCMGGAAGVDGGPKVKYDGRTPTEETARLLESGSICGCREPTVDACDGYPKCPGELVHAPYFFRFLRPGGGNGSFSSEDLHRTDHFIFRGIFALPENAERNRIYVPHVLLPPPPSSLASI